MKALILIDVQNDFCPGGALAVPTGDEIIPLINHLQQSRYFNLVVATRDWHPANHLSFASQHTGHKIGDVIDLNGTPQVLWPDHCIQNTTGAEFHPQLHTSLIAYTVFKGQDRAIDSYSGFYDNDHLSSTGLGEYLKAAQVSEVFLCGLATDYCVKYSALDAQQLGFQTTLIEDACRGVNLNPDDSQNAITEMRSAGIRIVHSNDLPETTA